MGRGVGGGGRVIGLGMGSGVKGVDVSRGVVVSAGVAVGIPATAVATRSSTIC